MSSVMPTYARVDLAFERGRGAHLFTGDGARYLDFAGGVAVSALGHDHPHLVTALTDQARILWHTSNLYRIPGQERLAERLCAHSFADAVFFCNSGAEAMEGAIKTARRFHHHEGRPGRYRVITYSGAFHGRTLATIAAGDNAKAREGFGPPVEGFDRVKFGDLAATEAAITEETAAIAVEPVQGEGGVWPAPQGFLRGLRDLADARGLALIFDEVQTGMGRTGKLFAHEWDGVSPDVMAVAKGFGGGFPIGAVLATARAAAGMGPGSHGSTFGGNLLAAACGNAVLDILLEDGFLDHVTAIGEKLAETVKAVAAEFPSVIDTVRGRGLLLGMRGPAPNGALVEALRNEKVLAVAAGDNVTRFVPPLIIDDSHVEEAGRALARAARTLAS